MRKFDAPQQSTQKHEAKLLEQHNSVDGGDSLGKWKAITPLEEGTPGPSDRYKSTYRRYGKEGRWGYSEQTTQKYSLPPGSGPSDTPHRPKFKRERRSLDTIALFSKVAHLKPNRKRPVPFDCVAFLSLCKVRASLLKSFPLQFPVF